MERSNFEEDSYRIIRSLEFQVIGYYPYEHASNLVGYLKQPDPLSIPIKLAVEIAKSPLSKDSVVSFSKFGINILAQKLCIFHWVDFEDLDEEIKLVLTDLKIDYVGGKKLENYLSKITVTSEEAKEYKNSLDILSPKRLVEILPDLSSKTIPNDILTILGDKFEAWEILEDAVFAAFKYCFSYDTQKLGYDKRFGTEPEGEVITNNETPFALLYDCKSTDEHYNMSKADERAITDYINQKTGKIKARYGIKLKYFLIVSSDFRGNLELRKENILKNTQNILLVFMKAEALKTISLWILNLPTRLKKQVDLREIFSLKRQIIDVDIVLRFMKNFDSEYQKVY